MMSNAASNFRYTRRAQFAETDLAGIVHFTSVFRYMEEAEHALWRAAGLRIADPASDIGWPRISASFDFKKPLYFEDEFEVAVRVAEATRRAICYAFVITRGDTLIGSGILTAACVVKRPDGSMQAIDIPPDIVRRLTSICLA